MRCYQSLPLALFLSFAAAPAFADRATDARETIIAPKDASAGHVRVEPPEPRPALKTPKKGAWPFTSWSYAKAYTYNFFPMQEMPNGLLIDVVAADGTWNKHIRSEQLISGEQALTAASLVAESKGSFETSKCILPRHAIVLFDQNDKPVGAANVCFECEGISVWPDYERPEDADYDAGEKRFLAALAKWKTLFGAELGLSVDYQNVP